MTFPHPEYNIYDFKSTYPYNVGPNPFTQQGQYQGADIVSAYDNDYPEGPQDNIAFLRFLRSTLGLPFNCLRKMEDALPEELL